MSEYNIAVCDDDSRFAEELVRLCEKVMLKTNIPFTVSSFSSAQELDKEFSRDTDIDLLFLDIKLGEQSGIEIAGRLRDNGKKCSVVLMTVDSSYLLEGYTVQPIYFLMKPISEEELEKAVKTDLKRRIQNSSLFIKCERRQVQIPVDSITYIEVLDHAMTVHTRAKDYVARMTFSKLLERLPQTHFARCHNSYAVNLSCVRRYSRIDGVTLDSGITLPIGRKYFDDFRRRFVEFMDIY